MAGPRNQSEKPGQDSAAHGLSVLSTLPSAGTVIHHRRTAHPCPGPEQGLTLAPDPSPPTALPRASRHACRPLQTSLHLIPPHRAGGSSPRGGGSDGEGGQGTLLERSVCPKSSPCRNRPVSALSAHLSHVFPLKDTKVISRHRWPTVPYFTRA